ncbi:MAG TPA: tetratricopeptide repeat protein [Gemmatimonadaceae bacterium]
MPDVAKLKKKAAELELKKQFDKALAVYVEILQTYDKSDDEIDVGLYNRVGDIYLKQGNVADALDYYEKAVDKYADSGFFNNAIALCNKILRNSPGRASIYYKLGKISAQKGFVSDAKINFLEYADRMQKAGKKDEAFRALKEFADLCPDQDDVRLLLADQLSKQERGSEALDQLQLLYQRYTAQGRELEARATVDRMKAIDPSAQPRESDGAPRGANDLVFLDLEEERRSRNNAVIAKRAMQGLDLIHTGEVQEIAPPKAEPKPEPKPAPVVPVAPPVPEPALQDIPAPTPEVLETSAIEPALLDGLTRAGEFVHEEELRSPLDGLNDVVLETDGMPELSGSARMLDLEPTDLSASFAPRSAPPAAPATPTPIGTSVQPEPIAPAEPAPDLVDFAMPEPRAGQPVASVADLPFILEPEIAAPAPVASSPRGGEPELEEEPSIGGDLPLIMPEEEPASAQPDALADIPLMDLSLPTPGEAMASIKGVPVDSGPAIDFLDVDDLVSAKSEEPPSASAPAVSKTGDFEAISGIPTPPAARPSHTIEAEHSVELLKTLLEEVPGDHFRRQQLAEAMLESGDREGGLRELETAMIGFERADELASAASIADEIVRLNPESVRHHQKRVEYAFRTNERGRLLEAYLALADALFRNGQSDKSRAIYHRVIELAPDDLRAQAALQNFAEEEAEPELPPPPPPRERSTSGVVPRVPPRPLSPVPDDEFVNLGDWLRDDDAPKDTRMVVAEKEPTGDEEADFQDMLRKFKQGIADNVDEEDHQSHYDLGVAYKEMGLLDEAIAEFQKALRGPSNRVPTYEALGQCFMEKDQVPMAATILSRAIHEKGVSDDQLVGVLYLLGRCAEIRGQRDQALEYYHRVFVVDIQFKDVGERLTTIESAR